MLIVEIDECQRGDRLELMRRGANFAVLMRLCLIRSKGDIWGVRDVLLDCVHRRNGVVEGVLLRRVMCESVNHSHAVRILDVRTRQSDALPNLFYLHVASIAVHVYVCGNVLFVWI